HILNSRVPVIVGSPGLLQDLAYLGLIRVNLNLNLIEYCTEILVVLGVNDLAYVLQLESLLYSLLRYAYPGYVPLADVHDTLGLVDKVVVLPLKNRLEIFLEVTASDLSHHGKVEPRSRLY